MENTRCDWCLVEESMINYHDNEWGIPVHDDIKHFEFILLDTFQAGLSWRTILNKREGFRRAFADFDLETVANFTPNHVEGLLLNPEIIRNRLKIQGAIKNAQAFLKIQEEFGSFDKYIWNFVDGKPQVNLPKTMKDIPATSTLSDKVSKALKKRGFSYVGSTTCYAYLQAAGLVNDHLESCWKK